MSSSIQWYTTISPILPPSSLPYDNSPKHFSFEETAVESVLIKKSSLQSRLIEQESISPIRLSEHGLQVDNFAKELGTYKKFSEAELIECELQVGDEGNLVIGSKQELLDTAYNEMMYLMHKNGKIYVAYPQVEVCYHSSLVPDSFDWPIAAGMLRGKNGKLLSINDESGHFPSFHRAELVVQAFNKAGARIDSLQVVRSKLRPSPGHRMKPTNLPSPIERLHKLDTILADKAAILILKASSPSPEPGHIPFPLSPLNRSRSLSSTIKRSSSPITLGDRGSPSTSFSSLSPRLKRLLSQETGSPLGGTFIEFTKSQERSLTRRGSSHNIVQLPQPENEGDTIS